MLRLFDTSLKYLCHDSRKDYNKLLTYEVLFEVCIIVGCRQVYTFFGGKRQESSGR